MTPHFLQILCVECSNLFKNNEGSDSPPRPVEAGSSSGQTLSKIIPILQSPLAAARAFDFQFWRGHFTKNIRQYNSALAMASTSAEFVSRSTGVSKYNPIITVHGRFYVEIGALQLADVMFPRYALVYMNDMKNATSKSMQFYRGVREDLLLWLEHMLEQNNNLVKSFLSLRDLTQKNGIPDDAKLVIRAHEKTFPGHVRKYNVAEASEVAALIVSEQHGKINILLRRSSEYDTNVFEKLGFTGLGHLIMTLLLVCCYFRIGITGGMLCSSPTISEEIYKNVSPMEFYSWLLFERTSIFNVLLHSGRLFQK